MNLGAGSLWSVKLYLTRTSGRIKLWTERTKLQTTIRLSPEYKRPNYSEDNL